MPRHAARQFATNARVHPSFLPHLHAPQRLAVRWVAPAAAIMCIGSSVFCLGYAANTYRQTLMQRRAISMKAAEQEAANNRELAAKLMDAYGNRTSIEELEQAMMVYEASSQE